MKASITTNKGTISLELFKDKAPLTVANFANLSNRGFYNDLTFHRVIDNFMVQTGCPNGTSAGGPGYEFQDEFHSELKHNKPGILSMANSGPNTNGSQFFITHVETPWLDNNHTVFGSVSDEKSQDIINAIEQGDTISSIQIEGEFLQDKEILKTLEIWNDLIDG